MSESQLLPNPLLKALRVRALRLKRESFTLQVDAFTLLPGEKLLIRAPSGFGKSSLVRALAGFDPCEGALFVGEKRIDTLPAHERGLGILFQDQLLFPHLSAVENVMVGLQLRGVLRVEAKSQALEEMEQLGLASRAHANVVELSGGERQRVALLRAIIFKPDALILDEPYRGLDTLSKEKMVRYLSQFLQKTPTPTLIISHQNESCELELWGETDPNDRDLKHRHFRKRTRPQP